MKKYLMNLLKKESTTKIETLPKGQKGTLNYQTYSDEEKKKMTKYLRKRGYEDWMHWNNWIKTEWIKQQKKYDTMGSSLLSCYLTEKKKENNQK